MWTAPRPTAASSASVPPAESATRRPAGGLCATAALRTGATTPGVEAGDGAASAAGPTISSSGTRQARAAVSL
jgi:hypothetical protein